MSKYCELCYRTKTAKETSKRVAWTMFMFWYLCPECEKRMKKENLNIMEMKSGQWASAEILKEIEDYKNEVFEISDDEEKNKDVSKRAHWLMEHCDQDEYRAIEQAIEEYEEDKRERLEWEKVG